MDENLREYLKMTYHIIKNYINLIELSNFRDDIYFGRCTIESIDKRVKTWNKNHQLELISFVQFVRNKKIKSIIDIIDDN